jgi:hypothetical protein
MCSLERAFTERTRRSSTHSRYTPHILYSFLTSPFLITTDDRRVHYCCMMLTKLFYKGSLHSMCLISKGQMQFGSSVTPSLSSSCDADLRSSRADFPLLCSRKWLFPLIIQNDSTLHWIVATRSALLTVYSPAMSQPWKTVTIASHWTLAHRPVRHVQFAWKVPTILWNQRRRIVENAASLICKNVFSLGTLQQ